MKELMDFSVLKYLNELLKAQKLGIALFTKEKPTEFYSEWQIIPERNRYQVLYLSSGSQDDSGHEAVS